MYPPFYPPYPAYDPSTFLSRPTNVSQQPTIISDLLSRRDLREDPGIFIKEAEHSFSDSRPRKYVSLTRMFLREGEPQDTTDSRCTFSLSTGKATMVESSDLETLQEEIIAENLMFPYYTLSLFSSPSQASKFLSSLPRSLEDNKYLLTIWLKNQVGWKRVAPYLQDEDHPSYEISRPVRSVPNSAPRQGSQQARGRSPSSLRSDSLRSSKTLEELGDNVPGTQDKLSLETANPELKVMTVWELRKELNNPETLLRTERNDLSGIPFTPSGSINIINLSEEARYKEYLPFFSTVGRSAYLSGVLKTYTFSVSEYTPSSATTGISGAIGTRGSRRQVPSSLLAARNSSVLSDRPHSWEGVEWLTMKGTGDAFSTRHLYEALRFSTFSNEPSDLGRSYYQVYLEYASYDEEFNKFKVQDFCVASYSHDASSGLWYPHPAGKTGGFSLPSLEGLLKNVPIKPTLASMLEAAGSGTDAGTSIFLLSGRIKVKVANFVRAGGNDRGLLSALLELACSPPSSGIKVSKRTVVNKEYGIENINGTYIVKSSLGTLLAKPTKDQNDCFFSALLPYVREKHDLFFGEGSRKTPKGKDLSITYHRLRSAFDLKFNKQKNSMVSIEEGTEYASSLETYLLILDENGDLINSRYLPAEVPDRWTVATILLYRKHYFTLHSKAQQMRAAASALSVPELSKNKIAGHDITVQLKAFIDFETVYDTDTVSQALRTYSASLYLKWGKVTYKYNEDDEVLTFDALESYTRDLERSLQDRVIPPVTHIRSDVDENKILSSCLSDIDSTLSSLRDGWKPLHSSGRIHQLNLDVIFIAYNGSRFDFVPIFRYLDKAGYRYDTSTPVASSGKLSKFRFFSSYSNVKTLWPDLQRERYNTRVTRRYSVWDPNCFVSGSLSSVLTSFRVSQEKLSFDHEAMQKAYTRGLTNKDYWINYLSKMKPQLKLYNERDVTALAELTEKLEEVFSIEAGVSNLLSKPTMASLAYSVLRDTEVLEWNPEWVEEERSDWDRREQEKTPFSLIGLSQLSHRINGAEEVDSGMLFSDCLSKVPDSLDLFIRRGIIAGRVSSGAGQIRG